MKRGIHFLLTASVICTVVMAPISTATAYAHGHHGGGHGNRCYNAAPEYYYCYGHDAHLHANGVCPYAEQHHDEGGYYDNSYDNSYNGVYDDTYNNADNTYDGAYNNADNTYDGAYNNADSNVGSNYTYSHGCFSYMYFKNHHKQPHCRFLTPSAAALPY